MKSFYPLVFGVLLNFSVFGQWTDISSSRLDITFSNPATGWMVGAGGTILKSTDGGATWINLATPTQPNQNIIRIFVFDNGQNVRIVANNSSTFTRQGNIWSSSDGGVTWKEDRKHSFEMIDAHFIDALTGWYWVRDDISGNHPVYHTADGGATWAEVTELSSASNMFTLGNTTWALVRIGEKYYLAKSTDKGVSWIKNEIAAPVFNTWYNYAVFEFLDDQTGWMTNRVANTFYKTTDGGLTWVEVKYKAVQYGDVVKNLLFIDSSTGYLIANEDENFDHIYKTVDGGQSWDLIFTSPDMYTIDFNAFHFFDADHGVVVGSNGYYAFTEDGGASWTQTNFCTAGSNYEISDVAFNKDDVWLTGEGILHHSSNGHEWVEHSEMLLQDSWDYTSLAFDTRDEGHGTLVGEVRYASTDDNGNTWIRKTPAFEWSPDYYRESVWYDSAGSIWVVAVNGTLYRSDDNGASYQIKYSFPSNLAGWVRMAFQSMDKIWVYEDLRLLRSQDGGETWTVTRESIEALHFVTSSIGWKMTTDRKVYKTTDGGINWTLLTTINSFSRFPFMFFADEKVGWIADQLATVYKTVDGGQSWVKETTGVGYRINDLAFRKSSSGKIIGYLAGRRVLKFAGDYTPLPIAEQPDTQSPLLVSRVPVVGATDVDPSQPLVLTFNEKAALGTGQVKVFDALNDNLVIGIAIASANTVISGSTATIALGDLLPTDATLYVRIDYGAFEDLAGNPFTGIADKSWSFTTRKAPEFEAPTLVSKFPLEGAVGVMPAEVLRLTFNEDVVLGVGSLRIFNHSTRALLAKMDLLPTNTTISGKVVTIRPPAGLPSGTTLYVQLDAGAITDLFDNSFGGIADESWSFSVALNVVDSTAPTIIGTIPAHRSSEIDPGSPLVVEFSEPVMLVSGKLKVVYFENGFAVVQPIALNTANTTIAGSRVTIIPDEALPANKAIDILIDESLFMDMSNNNFPGIKYPGYWSFSTLPAKDVTAPLLVSTTPANGAIDVAPDVSLVLNFNEPVELGDGVLMVSALPENSRILEIDLDGSNTVIDEGIVTVTLSAPLPYGETYSINISAGAITDTAGNSFAGIEDQRWKFSTHNVITGLENPSLVHDIIIQGSGDALCITPTSGDIAINQITDVLGRSIDHWRNGNHVIVRRSTGLIILHCQVGSRKYAVKFLITE